MEKATYLRLLGQKVIAWWDHPGQSSQHVNGVLKHVGIDALVLDDHGKEVIVPLSRVISVKQDEKKS